MRRRSWIPVLASLTLGLCVAPPAKADDETAAQSANHGFHFGLGGEILFPIDHGPIGGGVDLNFRYGLSANPVYISPGLRFAGYYQSAAFIGIAMPTLRVAIPAGPLDPYVLAGVGIGGVTDPSDTGLAIMAGGGLLIHLGKFVALGVEVTYEGISNTGFSNIAVGPKLSLFP